MNKDEILRIPSSKLIVNIRGNKPILLDKMIYTEHPLSSKLKDSSITNYIPEWTKNNATDEPRKKINKNNTTDADIERRKITWENF